MENKEKFVTEFLKPLLIALNLGITNAVYKQDKYSEVVTLSYIDGSQCKINVHMDSLPALSRDVLRGL